MAEHHGIIESNSQQDIQMRNIALRDQLKAQQSRTEQQSSPLPQPPRKKARITTARRPRAEKKRKGRSVEVGSPRFLLGILFGFFQGISEVPRFQYYNYSITQHKIIIIIII